MDETYVEGKEKNKHAAKRRGLRGPSGKAIVAGMKDRDTNQVRAQAVDAGNAATLQGFVIEHVEPTAQVYTDESTAYKGMAFEHDTVTHSAGEYVRGEISANGIESFWALFKRGYKGIYHWMSAKHLDRYVQEFAGHHNMRNLDTIDQMKAVAKGLERKRLRYRDLVG